jgi:DMSO/TMAO reductase YedYZ molybdopterin-dependent catalytic subunit
MNAGRIRLGRLVMYAMAGVLALGGCGGQAPSGAGTMPAGPTATATALPLTIPEPKGASLLTISGKIGAGNKGDAMVLDEDAVAGLAKLDLTFNDPFQKKTLTLKGVWMADLLAAAEVTDAAQSVHMTALDDYVIDFTMAEVRAGGMFLAVADQNGDRLSLENGGPSRIVFVDGTPAGANSDKWIWSLATIEVK